MGRKLLLVLGVVVPLAWACSVDTAGEGSSRTPANDAGATGGSGGSTIDSGGSGGSGGGFPDATPPDAGPDAPSDAPSDVNGDAPGDACQPLTCADVGASCGSVSDGCGGSLDCGGCAPPAACHSGTCVAVLYVDHSAAGKGDGSSWKDAYTTIDAALAVAQPAWQIWVAKGTYKRTSTTAQTVLVLPEGVELFGHFKGTEAAPGERDLANAANETVLDGENTYRVVQGATDAVLDGFAVVRGKAVQGAGLYALSVHNLTLANCRFENNQSSDSGGAIWASSSDLTLQRSSVASNTASSVAFGGGLYLTVSSATIDHCTLSQNSAGTGGALYALSSDVLAIASTFAENQGVYSQSGGGGAFIQNTTGKFSDCVFSGNTATQAFGGGIYNETASPTIENCTFFGNDAALDGLDVFDNVGAVPVIVNSILYSAGNASPLHDYAGAGPAKATYSDIRGGWTGSGNIDADPMFVDAKNGNLQLATGSPCIDAADGDQAPATDANDQPRYDDPNTTDTGAGNVTYADIGAYEFQGK